MPVLERLSPEDVLNRAQTELGDLVSDLKLNFGQLDLVCRPDELHAVLTTLRDAESLGCRFFSFLSAIDWTEFEVEGHERRTDGLELLVHVYSPEKAFGVNVHVALEGSEPTCPSITSIFLGALWHERETHEMFGIDFEGHPKLVGLYLPEDFEGHPLLKSFKLPSRAYVKEWPGAKDPEEAAAGGR